MRNIILAVALVVVITAGATFWLARQPCSWSGVDETVVEKYAEAAGRPARKPYINTDQGDLLLFCFVIAGAAGGFVSGYCFRELFPPKKGDNP